MDRLKRLAAAHRAKLLAAAAAAAAIWILDQRRRKARRRQLSGPKVTRGERSAGSPKEGQKGGIGALYRLLWPSKPFSSSAQGAGSWELAGMLILCISRVWLMNRQSELVGALDSNMMTRNQSEFWRLFKSTAVLALMSTVHRNIYKFVESRLGIVWHKKLTALLHRDYFNEMACVRLNCRLTTPP
jgi:ABC-type uncharacterized transport system fused permease/ATPase subunit